MYALSNFRKLCPQSSPAKVKPRLATVVIKSNPPCLGDNRVHVHKKRRIDEEGATAVGPFISGE